MELNKIYCIDCLEGMKQLDDDSIDHVITDFPYNVGKDYNNDSDKRDLNEHLEWLDKVCIEIKRLLKENGNFVFYIGTKNLPKKLNIIDNYFTFEWVLTQYKPTFRHFGKTGFTKIDYIYWFSKNGGKVYHRSPDIIIDKSEHLKVAHPTFKGKIVMKQLVETFSEKDDVILDPFIGSGSTAIACKSLGRQYMGFEINHEYVEVAKKRIQKLSNIDKWI